MGKVVLKYCNNYDIGLIEKLLRHAISILGIDLGAHVTGKKVLLKPNLLGAHPPERCVTTHPVFIEALIRILKDYSCELWLGDSPNGVQKSLEDIWLKTGMDSLCNRYGVTKKFFEREGATIKGDLLISNVVLGADYIINLPKFKTHGLAILTAAVKNMFGAVPGLKKTDYHRICPLHADFARTIVRIAEAGRPGLNIVDGIRAMAGNGPSGGYVAEVGLIAVGADMHAVDLALARLMGVVPAHIDTLNEAGKLGLINLEGDLQLLGDGISAFNMKDFRLPVTYTAGLRNFKLFDLLISKYLGSLRVKPRVVESKCKKCGMCVNICPASAIEFRGDYPRIDNGRCSECYCCSEVCPEGAVELRESLFLKAAKKFSHANS